MMKTKTKRNLLIWSVVILVLLNISSLGTIWYHRYQYAHIRQDRRYNDKYMGQHNRMMKNHKPGSPAFMTKGLKLSGNQQQKFDSIWKKYSTLRMNIEREMAINRNKMGDIMSLPNPDTSQFSNFSAKQGILMQNLDHTMLEMNMALRSTLEDKQMKLFLDRIDMLNKTRFPEPRQEPGMRKRAK